MRISDWSADVCSSDLILLISPLSNRFKRDPLVEATAGDRAAERGASSDKLLESPMRCRTDLHDTIRPRSSSQTAKHTCFSPLQSLRTGAVCNIDRKGCVWGQVRQVRGHPRAHR